MLYQKHKEKLGNEENFIKKIYARDGLRNEVNLFVSSYFLCWFHYEKIHNRF